MILPAAAFLLATAATAAAQAPPGYVDASTFGYNATDATDALQAAIDTGEDVYVPNMGTDWIVAPITFTNSYQTILFEDGVVVRNLYGAYHHTSISMFTAPAGTTHLNLIGYGATILCLPYEETAYTDEEGHYTYLKSQRHVIKLDQVEDSLVEGFTLKTIDGDGISVTSSDPNGYCSWLTIADIVANECTRNGISVISADHLTIDNVVAMNTDNNYGNTNPKDGIDFEPYAVGQILTNIKVRNSIFTANANDGVNLSISRLAGGSPSQVSGILLENNTFYNNGRYGFTSDRVANKVITVRNCLFVSNQSYGAYGKTANPFNVASPRITISYSAFWNNAGTIPSGNWIVTGPGTLTNVSVPFYSTDPASPYFLYLDPSVSSAISHGSNTGSYMGARPVYTP